jgi:biotin transport system substrate-specific component
MFARLQARAQQAKPKLKTRRILMSATLASQLWPQTSTNSLTRQAVLVIAGSLLVAAAAQITIPTAPVPFTLQTFAVLAVGAAYGSRLGAATLGLYAVLGSVLPFFQNASSGWFDAKAATYLPASTMGYIVGFILAAWLVGRIVESGYANAFVRSIVATIIGAAVLYLPGVLWLAQWASISGVVPEGQTAIGAALDWGLYPFVMWDAVKALLAGLAVPALGVVFARK